MSEQELLLTVEETHGPLAVATVGGEIDFHTAPILRSRALDLIEQGRSRLVLDLSGVGFCDSAGLNALINIWHAAQGAGGAMALASVPARLDRMLKLTGLDTVLAIYPTAAAAIAAVGPRPGGEQIVG
ncbi:STAS domain-containing protein [Streptomyces sp. NPDC056600]|uniref:STAS domain-containing protein n=1 Tax=Streptomyces sp. NPDC056600 TaxID=3345874 RepID=UPI003683E68B